MEKNKKQFGVWMDSRHASVVGREGVDSGDFALLGHFKNAGPNKFFKEITSVMQNVDEIHITGTGQIQEQFMKYLAETAQYKNVVSSESTSNKMDDAHLVEYISEYFK